MKTASPFDNFKELASLIVNMIKSEDNNLIEVRMGAKIIGLDNQFIILDQASLRECLYLCDYITGIKLDIPWDPDINLLEGDNTSAYYNFIYKRVSADFFEVEQKIAVGINIPGIGAFDTSIKGTDTLNGPGGASGRIFRNPRYATLSLKESHEKEIDIAIDEIEVSPRITDSYTARTYILYNNNDSYVGEISGTGNVFYHHSNTVPMEFRFGYPTSIKYLSIYNAYGDPVIYAGTSKTLRLGSDSGIAFWGDGFQETSSIPNVFLDKYGELGINVKNPSAKLHVNGTAKFENNVDITKGNLSISNGDLTIMDSIFNITWGDSNIRNFFIQEGINKDRIWLGTKSNHLLTIGTNGDGQVNFMPGKYTVFYKNSSALYPIPISEANKAKYALFVEGGILSEGYSIGPVSSWADHVFSKDYNLKPLSEVASFINANNRLPDIPSKSEINEDGYSLHEMNVKFLQKIEELTLYVIAQNEKYEDLKSENEMIKQELGKLKK